MTTPTPARPTVAGLSAAGLARTEQDIFWDVLRERDDYRSRVHAAAARIVAEAGTLRDASGNITALILPIEAWRSIRAMLQREPALLTDAGEGGAGGGSGG